MNSHHNIKIFKPRQCDYNKSKKPDQPLSKDGNRLVQTDAPVYMGNDCYGTFNVMSKKDKPATLFYASYHFFVEYLAVEILQRLGINTPKIRLLVGDFATQKPIRPVLQNRGNVISKGFTDYIPMRHLLERCKHHFQDEPKNPRYRYYIDPASQTVLDMQTQKHLRISGHAFAYNIASMLIDDSDFQQDGHNFGLVRINQRFYAVTIDKEVANFSRTDLRDKLRWLSGMLQQNATTDQQLAIIQNMVSALEPNETGESDIDRIFHYSRVTATPELCHKRDEYLENFKTRARLIIAHFLKKDTNQLEAFAEREAIRVEIAEHVMDALNLPDQHLRDDLKPILIEDLRGPYYKNLFKNGEHISSTDRDNVTLHNALIKDFAEEFELEVRHCKTLSIGMTD